VAKRLAKLEDEKFMGPEPTLAEDCTDSDLAKAFNWYNYCCDNNQAKEFVIEYLRKIKYDKNEIKKFGRAKINNSTGWMARILTNGGHLPEGYGERMGAAIKAAIASVEPEVDNEPVVVKNVVSIQDRINNKASELIGELEEQIDILIVNGTNSFNAGNWFRNNNVKPQIASKIAAHYRPLYIELYDAFEGKDKELKEAYRHLKKLQLKNYVEFVRSILASAEARSITERASRKPRKKKVKPAAVLASKVKYLAECKDYNIASIKPAEIVGAQQLWVFNAKTRNLTVINAMSHAGLSIKGTTVIGFDEKTSITKKLRKPEQTLEILKVGSKIVLRKLMDNIKCKPSVANGRLNKDTVILRAVK
jgi:hypothetical protein